VRKEIVWWKVSGICGAGKTGLTSGRDTDKPENIFPPG
jgi:hypothetical protein